MESDLKESGTTQWTESDEETFEFKRPDPLAIYRVYKEIAEIVGDVTFR